MRRIRGLAIIAFLIACTQVGQGRKKPADEVGSELGQAPPAAQAWRNPYAGKAQAVMAGKKLYQRYCAHCHGLDGGGRDKAPDLKSSVVQKAFPGALFWFLKNGNRREGMPSWSRLPDQQLWQLVSFLQTLR